MSHNKCKRYCSVYGCLSKRRLGDTTISFFKIPKDVERFPKDPIIKERWMEATGRVRWFPRPSSTICSEHFDPQDILLTKKGYKYISDSAVPTRNFLSYHETTPVAEPQSSKSDEMEVYLPLAQVKVEATPGPSRKRTADSSENPQQESPRSDDRSDDSEDSNDDLSSMLRYEQNKIKKQNLKMKRLQSKLKRLKMSIWNIQDLYTVLTEKLHISGEDIMSLENTEVKVSELAARRQTNKELSEVVSKLTYSPELRCFALTLHSISAKAYDYVRKTFKTSLPHPRTLKHWYLKVGGEPGFTKEAFVALKRKAETSDNPILATLVLGEIYVTRCVEVGGGGGLYGYVDMGTGLDTDMANYARQALVLYLTAINANFKVPIAYFLTDIVTSSQRAELVKLALEMSHDAGVKVVALSLAANNDNENMTTHLGCDLKKGLVTFKHPVTDEPIAAVLDPIDLLDDLQITFSNFDNIYDKNGEILEWKYIKELERKTYTEKSCYIDYQKVRNVAHQDLKLFSPRFLEGLQHSERERKVSNENEPTATFVSHCISIYDMFFNSHKNILSKENSKQMLELASSATEYISALKLADGSPVARRFATSLTFINGIKCLYSSFLETNILKSIPLRKLTQDNLKHFLWNIKAGAGYKADADPTPKKFILEYKKVVTQIKEINRNKNLPLEQIWIPKSSSPVDRLNRIAGFGIIHESKGKTDPLEQDLDSLSANNEDAIVEIAAHIVQELNRSIFCDTCSLALVTNNRGIFNNYIVAVDIRNTLYASSDVIKICKTSDMVLKGFNHKPSKEVNREIVMAKIMRQFIDTNIFDDICRHQLNEFPESNHVTDLMKAVVERYINIYYKYKKKENYKDVLWDLKQMWMESSTERYVYSGKRIFC